MHKYLYNMTKVKRHIRNNSYNRYDLGSWLNTAASKLGIGSSTNAAGAAKGTNLFGLTSGGTGLASAGLNIGSSLFNTFGNPNGNTTGVGNIMSTVGGLASNIPGVGGLIGAGVSTLGSVVNAAFGSNINKEAVNNLTAENTALANTTANTSSNNALLSQWSGTDFLSDILKKQVGSDGWFSKKAKKKTAQLNLQRDNARSAALNNLSDGADTIENNIMNNLLANYAAFGGVLNNRNSNPLSPFGNKFAYGGDFSNGVTVIDNGGTHEENPNEGVQMGIDQQGNPNLVEEGEVVFNDYVFSNRIKVPKDVKESYKLKGGKQTTFADAAKKAQKESEERPNDPISQRGLFDIMGKLANAQENERSVMESRKSNKFDNGGNISKIKNEAINPIGINKVIPTYNDFVKNNPYGTFDYLNSNTNSNNDNQSNMSWLRYAPVVGSGLSVLSDSLGVTNKPDYTNSDMVRNSVNNLPNINYTPIGNYLTYKPLDREFYINKLNAQSGATRRAIVSQSGSNRASATAGLLAADYNAQSQLGNLARQAEEYNQAQRAQVEQFNRGTNQANSEMDMKAQLANQSNRELILRARMAEAQMRDQIESRAGAAKSSNLSTFFNNLGNVGIDEANRADRDFLIRSGVFGTLPTNNKKAKGGKLKKRGLLY